MSPTPNWIRQGLNQTREPFACSLTAQGSQGFMNPESLRIDWTSVPAPTHFLLLCPSPEPGDNWQFYAATLMRTA
jgi:hypothetical protein